MPVPTINTTQSVLGARVGVPFEFQAYATEAPFFWDATGLPTGLSIDTPAAKNATIEANDDIVSCTAHGYLDGDRIYFSALAGGTGLSTNTIYYVRDKTTDGFKVAASPAGAAIDISVDYSSATVRKVSSGKITGTPTASGVSVVGLRATNATGTSAEQIFTIGVEGAGGGSGGGAETSLTDGTIPVSIDLVTRQVTVPGGAEEGLYFKRGDGAIFNVYFTKGDATCVPTLADLTLRFKHLEGEAVLATSSAFRAVTTSTPNFWQVAIAFDSQALTDAVNDQEGVPVPIASSGQNIVQTDPDKVTAFDGIGEFEWQETISGWGGGPAEVRGSSRHFPIRIVRDLGETA